MIYLPFIFKRIQSDMEAPAGYRPFNSLSSIEQQSIKETMKDNGKLFYHYKGNWQKLRPILYRAAIDMNMCITPFLTRESIQETFTSATEQGRYKYLTENIKNNF